MTADPDEMVRALEHDLIDHFTRHDVAPADAVIAMLHITATIIANCGGSAGQVLHGGQIAIDSFRESIADIIARRLKEGTLK